MIYPLEINLTENELPPPNILVVVEGGVARWNGKDWLSAIDEERVIQWKVKWWAYFPVSPLEQYDQR